MPQRHGEILNLVIAWPRDEKERDLLRQLIKADGLKLPVIVPNSVDMKCETCPRILAVGPRTRAFILHGHAVLACIQCAITYYGVTDVSPTVSLGNPDSKFED